MRSTSIPILSLAGIFVFGICSISAIAQEKTQDVGNDQPVAVADDSAAVDTYNIWTAKKLTGDWGGARTAMEEQGIEISLRGNTQFMVNMRGGRETKNGNDFGGSYDFKLDLDLERMGVIPGGSIYFQAKGTFGGDDSDFDREKIGALFKTNNDAKTEEPLYVDKWWWQQRLFDGKIVFVLGRIGTDKDFIDVNEVAGHEDKQFLNRALVLNSTIPHKNGLGLFVKYKPCDWFYVSAAAVDPQARDRRTGFDTAFHGDDRIRAFGEIGLMPKFNSANGELSGTYRFGTWYQPYPKQVFRDTLDGALAEKYRSGDMGFYFGFDQLVWKENSDIKDKQGISVFGRYGYAHGDVNRIEHFWSVGGQYVGLIPDRDKDVLGLGMAQSILSDQYRAEVNEKADRETVYELYYACQVTPWCYITPDLQYVTNAGGDKDDPNAFIAGMRFRIEF